MFQELTPLAVSMQSGKGCIALYLDQAYREALAYQRVLGLIERVATLEICPPLLHCSAKALLYVSTERLASVASIPER
jgi:hypothetical protein